MTLKRPDTQDGELASLLFVEEVAFEGRRGASPSSKHTARTQLLSVGLSGGNSPTSELSAGLDENAASTCCAHSCAPELRN